MKENKKLRKLNLQKEDIIHLNEQEMDAVKGGNTAIISMVACPVSVITVTTTTTDIITSTPTPTPDPSNSGCACGCTPTPDPWGM